MKALPLITIAAASKRAWSIRSSSLAVMAAVVVVIDGAGSGEKVF